MLKKLYATAWILLAVTVFGSVMTGMTNWAVLVIYGLIALALVYALALRTVFENNRADTRRAEFERRTDY